MEYGQTSKQPGGQGDENTRYFGQDEMFGEGDFYLLENDEENDDLWQYLAASNEEINQNNDNNNTTGMLSVSNAAGSSERPEITTTKRKYQRHTTHQIQQLEDVFRQCPYPDESVRIELSQRLGLDLKQIKFWFQNKRIQAKAQALHEHDARLKDENNKLRNENEALKTALKIHPLCSDCKITLPPILLNGNVMIVENAHLGKHLAHPTFAGNNGALPSPNLGLMSTGNYSVVPGATGSSSSAGAVNNNGSQILGFPESSSGNNMTSAMVPNHQSNIWILQQAITATKELLIMADENDTSLIWIKGLDGKREILNHGKYSLTFPPILSIRPTNFVYEGTKSTAVVQSPVHALVDAFMYSEAWTRMFSSLISTASTVEIICPGVNGTKNGAVQLMQAEVQVISPMVPLCKLKFLRCCKQYAAEKWAVVDLSVDALTGINTEAPYLPFRQLPSGCLIEGLPNGCCKVTLIAHYEYEEGMVAPIYRPMLRAGLGYGSAVWLTRLERHCKCIALFSPSAISERGRSHQSSLSPTAQRGLLDVAQRMSDSFCYGVCGSKFQWMNIQTGNSENDYVYIKSRVSMDDPGEPSGIVLSATTSFWMPVARENLFEFLRKTHLINQWDLLSQGSQLQRVIYLNKGQDNDQNGVSVFCVTNMTTQETSAVIQDAWSDASGSLIVYAPTDISGIEAVMEGRDKSVAILPTGFAIYSDGKMSPPLGLVGNNITQNNLPEMGNIESCGSLLTIGFQVLSSSNPGNGINEGSVNVLNSLMVHTSNTIKAAMGCT